MLWINGCKGLAIIRFGVSFINLPWRSRHFHDRRTKEILQCNEEAGIQETTKTYTSTSGKNCAILISSVFGKKSQQYINYNKISPLKWFWPNSSYPFILNWNVHVSVLQEKYLIFFMPVEAENQRMWRNIGLLGFEGKTLNWHISYWTMVFLDFFSLLLGCILWERKNEMGGRKRMFIAYKYYHLFFFLPSEQIARSGVWYCNTATIWHHCYGSNLS